MKPGIYYAIFLILTGCYTVLTLLIPGPIMAKSFQNRFMKPGLMTGNTSLQKMK